MLAINPCKVESAQRQVYLPAFHVVYNVGALNQKITIVILHLHSPICRSTQLVARHPALRSSANMLQSPAQLRIQAVCAQPAGLRCPVLAGSRKQPGVLQRVGLQPQQLSTSTVLRPIGHGKFTHYVCSLMHLHACIHLLQ
jgi:hypothetical protein